jgi:endonuclease/exonuclease/phosphatase family metal-dependent hydrolase
VPLLVRTWNLYHGNTLPPRRRAFLREMVQLVTADGPDVVCLQEVPVWALRQLERWSGMQSVGAVATEPRLGSAELGRWLTELHHGLLRSAFTGQANAILVARRFAISHERSLVLSSSGERRVAQGLRLDGAIFVANLHATGGLPADGQCRLAADLVESQADEEAIVAGDLNLRPGEGRIYELLRRRRFSEPLPGSIDQIFVRGLPATPPVAWPVDRRRLDGRVLSDHAPVELTVG